MTGQERESIGPVEQRINEMCEQAFASGALTRPTEDLARTLAREIDLLREELNSENR